MSTSTLHSLDLESGEIPADLTVGEAVHEIQRQRDVIAGLERDIRGWAIRYADLDRDKEREAREDPLWPVARDLFDYWRETCGHPRPGWGRDRFELLRPFLKSKAYGETLEDRIAMCKRAIDGAAYDPYRTRRRNGTYKTHDGWDLIFRDRAHMEEFVNKAPREPTS